MTARFLFTLLLFAAACASPATAPMELPAMQVQTSSSKINGISMIASHKAIDPDFFDTLCKVNANYVCLLPFAFMPNHSTKIFYNTGFQEWGERLEGIASCIKMAHQCKLKVMVKPQLWIHDGQFTGHLSFHSEDDWREFEKSYTRYIFSLLSVANSMHAEMFCLGTELESFVEQRPAYWSWLIDTARSVYDGKLTYAENWDCFMRFPCWEKLDLIGVSAYFPLSETKTPSVDELKKAWEKNVVLLKNFSEKENKQILFTEFGYRSIDYCAVRPWESYSEGQSNSVAQMNAYTALFESFWKQPWFAGGFSWKWLDKNSSGDVPMETEYTPQGKPAMKVLQEWYAK